MAAKKPIVGLKTVFFSENLVIKGLKGVPLHFCGNSQMLWCFPCFILVYYSAGCAGRFQTVELSLENAKHTVLHNRYLDAV